MVEKTVDVEVKAKLQPPSRTREIDFKCSRGYKSLVKKDKDDANREHRDGTPKDKTKSQNFSSTNQHQTQAPKKVKCDRWGGHPATRINVTKVAKKDKDKAKDLSHVECYICK